MLFLQDLQEGAEGAEGEVRDQGTTGPKGEGTTDRCTRANAGI
jgi:hypothetical protein